MAQVPSCNSDLSDVVVTELPGFLTGRAEDSAAADGQVGLPILGVRNDTNAVRTSADGDYGMISLDDTGRVRVESTSPAVEASLSNIEATSLNIDASLNSIESSSLSISDDASSLPHGMAVLALLSRLVKVLESNQVVDAQQRQRVTVDFINSSAALAAVTTVTTVTTLANATAIAGMDREQYINIAKNTYANSIRTGLTFQ
jgi:hypothetical protein